jgi:hypothetical protein
MEPISPMFIRLVRLFSLSAPPSLKVSVCVLSYNNRWSQAEILAKYKSLINTTLLIPSLKQVEDTTAKALEYFKSARHIILYYEDVVKNRRVS